MKMRAAHRHLEYPYLSDGETQASTKLEVVADASDLRLRSGSARCGTRGVSTTTRASTLVTSRDARNAIDALLAGQPVPVAGRPPAGARRVYDRSLAVREAELATIAAEPVTLEMVGADGLKALRQNGTGKLLLVNFWATWCGPCVTEFPELEATYRMYRGRDFDFVSVSANDPEEQARRGRVPAEAARVHRNLQFATPDIYELQAAFDPNDARAGAVHAPPRAKRRRPLSGTGRIGHPEAAASDSGESAGRQRLRRPAGLLVPRVTRSHPTSEAYMTPQPFNRIPPLFARRSRGA